MATKTRQLADFLLEGGVQDIAVQQNPHIQPGLLYPSYVASGTSNKLMDGTTDHSGAWGTEQSDGRKYYYTNIKGRKPIKDPRIGAHYGVTRHRFSSIQKLHEQTAQNGEDVYSVDGRDWVMALWNPDASQTMYIQYDAKGEHLMWDANSASAFIEVTGYFNDANWLAHNQGESGSGAREFKWSMDGGSDSSTIGSTNANDVLGGRYVNSFSVFQMGVGTTLGIHTLKIKAVNNFSCLWFGIELFVQDTGTATRRNHVNIPAQNVVSFGKKFSIGSDTLTNAVHKHYNPFAFKTDGSTAWASGAHNGTSWPVGTGSSHNIDTATSLGLENWKHSSNYYKPYNGGRVVRWIDSDGTIKTSVTVMPPNARSIMNSGSLSGGANGTAKANASVANDTASPTFETGTIDFTLSEFAKIFHWREFGNGNANQGTGISGGDISTQSGAYADASMLYGTSDDICYTLDDGLTNLSGSDVQDNNSLRPVANGDYYHLTFIGTGLTLRLGVRKDVIAQNLPYGTHVVRIYRDADTHPYVHVDDVELGDPAIGTDGAFEEVTYHQPKKPPIPEDAVIISDYMLMAEFVRSTGAGMQRPSKGIRRQSPSRDCYVYSDGSPSFGGIPDIYDAHFPDFAVVLHSSTNRHAEIPYFGKEFLAHSYSTEQTGIKLDGSAAAHSATVGGAAQNSLYPDTQTSTLGIHKAQMYSIDSKAHLSFQGFDFACPIHTSSHYQPFETPFQIELLGGDRNMEQTNLICSPDGKTWDEVTRPDRSYLGHSVSMRVARDGGTITSNFIFDFFRGTSKKKTHYHKGIAIGGDRFYILEDGMYYVSYQNYHHGNDTACYVTVNTATANVDGGYIMRNDLGDETVHGARFLQLKRGDYVKVKVTNGTADGTNVGYNDFQINKVGS